MRPLSEISTNLALGPDGVWTTRAVSPVSYPEIGNELCFAIEDSSFWFRHRNQCILQAVRLLPPSGPIFDVGGGNGFVARALQDAGFEVVLVEPGPHGSANALGRGIRHVVRAAFGDAGFLPGSIPAIGLFDVLEHIADPQAFLASLARCLPPGGRIYVTVPASQWLWSREDEDAGHFRRYSLADLSRAFEESGFAVEYATHFFGFVPLPTLLRRVLPYRLGLAAKPGAVERARADHEVSSPIANRALEFLTARELRRLRLRRVSRFGGSCLAVGRKALNP
jgi:SAM-dependent methyltransferase